ncbi:MAG: ABC transporter ATP-binding protein [Blastocatellia bacterium]
MSSCPIIRASGLTRTYDGRSGLVAVFENLDLEVDRGELVAVIGASGVGKSTLLHTLGGLDRPTAGSLEVDGFDLVNSTEPDLCRFRNQRIGFVFQFHHLLPEFTALENVMMPLLISGAARTPAAIKARELLARVGLDRRADHRPGELSGGEQQRVALARALVHSPCLLLADEPTGNLDQQTGDAMFDLLCRLRAGSDLSAVIVTHNERLAAAADRVLRMENRSLRPDSAGD